MLRYYRCVKKPALPFLLVLTLVALALPSLAQAEEKGRCPNEPFRTGRSASLPDCRAYELVTPENLGRTEDMTFEHHEDNVLAAASGGALALRAAGVFLEPGVNISGASAVFAQTAHGWVMRPIATATMTGEEVVMELFSPDLAQVAFGSAKALSGTGGVFERGSKTLKIGPVGGPYTTVTTVPEAYQVGTQFRGANSGVEGGVSAFSDVLLESPDHALLPPGPEREVAEQTEPGRADLYEWSGDQLHLVNVDSQGRLLKCGATLGYKPGTLEGEAGAVNAVSADGSKVFFTSPQRVEIPGCPEPALYMRVDGRETVDVSAPQEGVTVAPGERAAVQYDGASADGSKVFFTTSTALTPDATGVVGPYLYEYATGAPVEHRLKLIANEVASIGRETLNPAYLVSEDGSAVYYEGACNVEANGQRIHVQGICRYETATETATGKTTFVAVPREAVGTHQPSFVTANGEFFLFQSGSSSPVEFLGPHGLEQEPRGNGGSQQLYRYDAADGSVMCVSCGEGAGPAVGFEELPYNTIFTFPDTLQTALAMSEDGRRVFFQTTADLVPQDGNGASEEDVEELGPGTDVYEWEQNGTEEAPGVFCRGVYGCTHLISTGEDVGPERFLGASASGRDVFFASAAQLLPQATPEFTNIYDARIDGGFPPAPASAECTSCQGVGSPPPSFGAPASATFAGAGNLAVALSPPPSGHTLKCARGRVRRDGRCVKAKVKRKPRGKRMRGHR